jgi:hypothetical protein
MSGCLDEIELEEALAGQAGEQAAAHLAECETCRGRLGEARALRERLRGALREVHVPDASADRVREMTVGLTPVPANQPGETGTPSVRRPWLLRRWGVLAMAASLLIILSVVVIQMTAPTSAQAAALELVNLHKQNLGGHHALISHDSHAESQAYLTEQLGFQPAVPDALGRGRIRACCVSRFLGRQAGNLVVDGPNGTISVIVSEMNARKLMTDRKITRNGRTYWVCPMEGYFTVGVQEGSLIYCAVGNDTPEHLVDLLDEILSRAGASRAD